VDIAASSIGPSRPRRRTAAPPATRHPFAHTRLAGNIVQLRTARCCDNPLIEQVTAAGVSADALHIAEARGARA
jgi:hypothetical protein